MPGWRPPYLGMWERLLCNSVAVWAGFRTECWFWLGNRNDKGYGRLSVWHQGRYQKLLAHRVSFTTFKEIDIPPDKEVDHLCQNPWCIAPDHLQLVPIPVNRGKLVQQRKKERTS